MSSCVVADGLLVAHGNDGEGRDWVRAWDAASGNAVWACEVPCPTRAHEMPIVPNGPGATPTIHEGRVFALTREGEFVCLQAKDGAVVWRRHLINDLGGKRPVYGYTQSPLVDGGRVILDVGAPEKQEGSTVALDLLTGEIVWRAGFGEAGYSSPRLFDRDGKRILALFKGEGLQVHDSASGKLLWSFKTTARDFSNALTPVFVGHKVLVSNTGTDPARLLDWDMADDANVREVWAHKQFALLFNNPILQDGHLFAFNEKRRGHIEFTCVDAATGESKWVSDAVPTGTFILAERHWIFLTREGECVLAPFSTSELKPSARFRAFEDRCYATPTLAGQRLYLKNNTGKIRAYDLTAPQ